MKIFQSMGNERKSSSDFALRRKLLLGMMLVCMAILALRAVYLQVFDTQFLQKQGEKRYVKDLDVPAYRGQILDRNNKPLAISTPLDSIWVNPQHFERDDNGAVKEEGKEKFRQVAKLLNVPLKKVERILRDDMRMHYIYLKRRVHPEIASKVRAMKVRGIKYDREFKRYYPTGTVSAHVVGFTDVKDVGQEGLERGYEHDLKGIVGKKRVIRDGDFNIISDVKKIKAPVPGQKLVLSIDQRLQYIAYKALQSAVIEHNAISAALVVLDAKNGEVLAVVNQPAFNPHIRKGLKKGFYRNRAMLDVFEPGSTVKPFVVAAALDGGYVNDHTKIETHGFYTVGRRLVKDGHDYGTLDLMHVLKKSSNVAASKIAMKMPKKYFWETYSQLGFGASAHVGFPGEASGTLLDYRKWKKIDQATMSFGYGVSTSVLQLARAYTTLADDGVLHSVSLIKRDHDYDSKQVFSAKTAIKVREMLEHVIKKDGTAYLARVDGYRVAGKTGTVKKSIAGGYADDRYLAVFVGMAPVSNPKFVIAVMVNEPRAGKYYGGQVAAPVFSKVMAGALRVYGIAPDKEESMPVLLTSAK